MVLWKPMLRMLVTYLVLLLSCMAKKVNTKLESGGDLPYWDSRIESLQSHLKHDPTDSSAWADLGIIYQVRDTIYHQGGSMQPKALEAFRNSLRLSPEGSQSFVVCHRMAILLKTMGAHRESVRAHDLSYTLADTPEKRATVMEQKGHAQWAFGRLLDAKASFLESVRLNPCVLSSFLPLVDVISEINRANGGGGEAAQRDWLALYEDIQYRVQRLELLIALNRDGKLTEFVASAQGRSNEPVFFITAEGAGGASSDPSGDNADGSRSGGTTEVAVVSTEQDELLTQLRIVLRDANITVGKLDFDIVYGSLADAVFALHKVGNLIKQGAADAPNPSPIYDMPTTGALWSHVQQANGIEVVRKPAYDEVEAAQKTAVLLSVFGPGFWAHDIGHPSTEVVFLVGFLRCGSVVVENLLRAHSKVASIGEDSIFNGYLPELRNGIVELSSRDGSQAEVAGLVDMYGDRVLEDMRARISMRMHMEGPFFSAVGGGSSGSLLGDDADKADKDQDKNMEEEEEEEEEEEQSGRSGGGIFEIGGSLPRRHRYIVDRMVFNYRNVGFAHLLYPASPILHVIRDPLDTILSVYQNKFDDAGLVWNTELDNIVLEYVAYLTEMAHWRKVLPGRIVEIVYEQLMLRPEAVTADLFESKLHLPMEPAVRELFSRQVSEELELDLDPNDLTHSRQRLHTGRIGHWRKYATQLKPTIKKLKTLLGALKRQEGGLPFAGEVNWNCKVDFHVYRTADAATAAAEARVAEAAAKRGRTKAQSNAQSKGKSSGSAVPKWFPQTKFDGRGSRITRSGIHQSNPPVTGGGVGSSSGTGVGIGGDNSRSDFARPRGPLSTLINIDMSTVHHHENGVEAVDDNIDPRSEIPKSELESMMPKLNKMDVHEEF